jgi:hypothetical protein
MSRGQVNARAEPSDIGRPRTTRVTAVEAAL